MDSSLLCVFCSDGNDLRPDLPPYFLCPHAVCRRCVRDKSASRAHGCPVCRAARNPVRAKKGERPSRLTGVVRVRPMSPAPSGLLPKPTPVRGDTAEGMRFDPPVRCGLCAPEAAGVYPDLLAYLHHRAGGHADHAASDLLEKIRGAMRSVLIES